jgi:hypothetical protein
MNFLVNADSMRLHGSIEIKTRLVNNIPNKKETEKQRRRQTATAANSVSVSVASIDSLINEENLKNSSISSESNENS